MIRCKGMAMAGLAAVVLSASALAAAPPGEQIRGTIESVNGNSVALKTYRGKTTDLTLAPDTKYVWVLPANLADIKSNDFVGITATGPESKMMALEVHIFPESMRGTGEGHYPWSLPAMVASADQGTAQSTSGSAAGAPPVAGTMTNGTVAGATEASGAPPVAGTMTNGAVTADTSQTGGKELTVTYGKGQKALILVPANAPVVRFAPATKAAVTQGAKTFIIASQQGDVLTASFVLVGRNGLMPPM